MSLLTLRTRPDKIASVCHPFGFGPSLTVRPLPECQEGTAIVCRVLTERSVYGDLELTSGRTARLLPGDVIVGVLGNRAALKGFSGRVPESIEQGQTLHLLNTGGVVGISSGVMVGLGEPIKLEVLGTPLLKGAPARLGDFGLKNANPPRRPVPLIAVAGTCMNSGKSTAAAALVRRFKAEGKIVHGGKATGVAAIRDTMAFLDHGASLSLSFIDCGVPSTAYRTDAPQICLRLLDHLMADEPDLVVVELGDGLLGSYGVDEILGDSSIQSRVTTVLLAANDVVGAVAGAEMITKMGYRVCCITGPATDNLAGVAKLEQLGWAAGNILREPDHLFAEVKRALAEGAK